MVDSNELENIQTTQGLFLNNISRQGPVLLVFLRHFGCVFCREALLDISRKKDEWMAKGVEIAFVHMSDPQTANKYFSNYNLEDTHHISDPDCTLYSKFGLTKGTTSQLFGLKNWVRGFEVAIKGKALPMVRQIGDGFQMPGVFIIKNGQVKQSYIHNTAADVPDYDTLLNCCAN